MVLPMCHEMMARAAQLERSKSGAIVSVHPSIDILRLGAAEAVPTQAQQKGVVRVSV